MEKAFFYKVRQVRLQALGTEDEGRGQKGSERQEVAFFLEHKFSKRSQNEGRSQKGSEGEEIIFFRT